MPGQKFFLLKLSRNEGDLFKRIKILEVIGTLLYLDEYACALNKATKIYYILCRCKIIFEPFFFLSGTSGVINATTCIDQRARSRERFIFYGTIKA